MPDKKPQIEKFREAARSLGSVGNDEYDDAVAKVAKAQRLSEEQIKKLVRDQRKEKRPA
ncbi:hypothetical protein [Mesorhizobium sp. AA22]|uniref:hypothetical protein n=1 Tax=Mesorhizobium sp. AA22 TaxID=1854057 RepID=UPI0012E99664|nr:hypothetical protein [Mesorhizobium sp. AA22]QIA20497.1 hypothetical protein A9K68_000930 [Mesorhizobium sp. AA22]